MKIKRLANLPIFKKAQQTTPYHSKGSIVLLVLFFVFFMAQANNILYKKTDIGQYAKYLFVETSSGEKSIDKGASLEGNYFWVVKLKDIAKPEQTKILIEALPNPVVTFSKVLVNYEYSEGNLTLYDLNARQLHQAALHGQHTFAIELDNPQGLHIVDVRINNGEDRVKVIKKQVLAKN